MGLHAHLLEPRRRTSILLPLHSLHRQPRPLRISLEPLSLDSAVCHLSLRLLDLGYSKQPEEHVQSTGTRCRIEPKDIPAAAVEGSQESCEHQDENWRLDSL